jgi:hypothetical protein
MLIFTLPFDILAWLIVLFVRLFWGQKLHWVGLVLQAEFKPGSWPMRTWYENWGGTSFGHGAIYRPKAAGDDGLDTKTEVHEHHHTEQFEGSMLFTFLVGLFCFFMDMELVYCLAIWFSGSFVPYFCSGFVALLRGEDFYRGNVQEEGAYAINDKPSEK